MRFFTLCLLFSAFAATAQSDKPRLLISQKRIALVIGNSDYLYAPRLASPSVDAKAMEQALQEVGFEVITLTDASLEEMELVLDEFTDRVEQDSIPVALCYYTGHGVQVNGENYLVPVDADIKRESDVRYKCLNAERLIDRMEEAHALTKIVLLDACRNNPFHKSWSKSVTNNGLAFMQAPAGTFIGFSTAPGTVAYDGSERNSPYTAAILENLKTPNLEISQVFNRVSRATQQWASAQGVSQVPFTSSSLSGDFYFLLEEGSLQDYLQQQESLREARQELELAVLAQIQANKEKPDTDYDGFSDDSDDCPNDYGTLRGCPDSDRDGIADHKDNCPFEAGIATNNGCPERDRDGDGVVDAVDKCPDKTGTKEWQGCPDSDGDGVPDHRDECWDIAGVLSNNGCPIRSTVLILHQDDLEFSVVEGDTVRLGSKNTYFGGISEYTVVLEEYKISTTEVTQAFWKKIMGSNPSFFNECDQCPVEQVSWNEIQEFFQQLNKGKKNTVYRLPTQAEWEYAARGGKFQKGQIYSGSNDIEAVGWYHTNSDNKTHPVQSKEPNPLRIFDMSGNVAEWCSDPIPDPFTFNTIKKDIYYVLRGGSWNSDKIYCRVVTRNFELPGYKANDAGFRIAFSSNKSKQ